MKPILLLLLIISIPESAFAQAVPAEEENIPFLVTFGGDAVSSWGDDDRTQIFFFSVPEDYNQPLFLRIFDPETGGSIDEIKGIPNTSTQYSVYGGKGAITDEDARKTDPAGNYRSGNLLSEKKFSDESEYDGKWYTFGPFNPAEGELSLEYGGRIFKLIAKGISGDDGNLYRYYMSTEADRNIPVEGGNAFTFEYSFRLHDDPRQVSHIYPYIDDRVISVRQANFDYDSDGIIRMVSVARKGEMVPVSGDNGWKLSEHTVYKEEINKSIDVQFIKNRTHPAKSNNIVFYITNQYGEYLPFYTIPIGGIPRYNYQIGVKPAGGSR